MSHHHPAPRRAAVLSLTVALALGSLLGASGAAPASAATPPVVQRDATAGVTADVLPTTQINAAGWVADQAIKGDTVFAGGKFTSARPAGSPAGTNESARSNLLAYSLSTGVLNTGFKPVLNGEIRVLALSPDKTRLYAGGTFTTVNGAGRAGVVAFDTATGRVVDAFKASTTGAVYALSATSTTVYAGGSFSAANGVNRQGLAAFRVSDGGLVSGWTPTIDRTTSSIRALLVAPGGRVVVGGSFTKVGRLGSSTTVTANGSAALDPSTGAAGTWKINAVVKQGGTGASVLSLQTDGTNVYGAGYRYGTTTANYEGTWAAGPSDGSVVWLGDCHGDTYDTTVLSGVVYVATHQHDCANIGGFPEQTPTRIERRATAFTATAKGTVQPNSLLPGTFSSFPGYGAPSLINWFPDFKNPTCTTEAPCLYDSQPTNTIESSGNYVVVGGQFPTVNGIAQQGIVRFAKPAVAPKKDGPRTYNGTGPTVRAVASNVMRVTAAPGDRDNLVLSRVELWRTDKTSAPVWAADNLTAPWWRTTVAYTDRGVSAGTTYSYYLKMTDPDGNTLTSGQGYAKTPASGAVSDTTYSQQVLTDGAASYWRLDDAPGSTRATDWAGQEDLTLQPGVTTGAAGVDGTDKAVTTSGATNASAAPGQANPAPQTFTAEAWFRTTAAGGQVIGYGNKAVGKSEIHDRQVYVTSTGQLAFNVSSGGSKTITSSKTYNDGRWHQVVASLSSGGMVLHVDGAKVASNATVTSAQSYTGFWRVAGDAVPGTGAVWLNGAVDEVSVYRTALSTTQVADHYKDATGVTPAAAPTAAFTTDCSGLACAYDASTSTPEKVAEGDAAPSIASYSWSLGDGKKATGAKVRHSYAKASSYAVSLTVTNSDKMTSTATQYVAAQGNAAPVAGFTSTVKSKKVSVDAKKSTDSDGTVKKYLWNFGDGATSTKKKVSHGYVGTGTYPVRLTVTDDKGTTGTTVRNVVIGKALAADGFGRTTASGWGTADQGGAWSTSPAGAFAVDGGRGTLTLDDKGDDATALLGTISSKKANVVGEVRVDEAGTGADTTAAYVLRHTRSGEYRAKLVLREKGAMLLVVSRVVDGNEKSVKSVKVKKTTYAAGTPLRVRATISSATKAKITMTVWKAGTKEPKAQLSTSDSTKALRRSGSVGVRGDQGTAGPVVLAYDNLFVTSS